ncbi:PST family polysaccharide transporter/antigen flippase [Sphingomonas endophytica]|uniref:PST family polysaccharide transporter/antigen flippase n=1 Tax=Sphingomonas endophytica TaxID=869719 RepID=A0A7X0MNJ9_9SPHN|nr:O-antigen translocase [Sphingomonas endophytica]MBB6505231.1 PST family polysaccharide transporter/antigen flippase [Sphingomonas endophytica]
MIRQHLHPMLFQRLAAPAAAALAHGMRMAVNLLVIKFIAVLVGPAGLGLLGNLMSVVTIMTVFAGGGIMNGITKYVAEYHSTPERFAAFLGSASLFGLTASAIVMIAALAAARPLAFVLFGHDGMAWIIPLVGVAHFLCFVGGAIVATVNGQRRPVDFAIITVAGYLGAVPVAFGLIRLGGVAGAAVALLAVAASTAIPAIIVAYNRGLLRLARPRVDGGDLRRLLRYTGITAVSAITFPVTEIIIRTQLTAHLDIGSTGIWQGLTRLSGAIMGFYTVFLATSHMPRLSAISDRRQAGTAVVKALGVVGPTFAGCAVLVYLGRSIIVPLLFSEAFQPMEKVLGWQLLGDTLRVCSYVVGFLGIAKAALKIHIAAELTQCGLYLLFTLSVLHAGYGLREVAQAYALTYGIYFAITLIALREYIRR